MEQTAPVAAQDPAGLGTLKAIYIHAQGHLDAALAAGGNKDELKPVGDLLTQIKGAIEQLDQVEQQQAQLAAQQAEEVAQEIAGGPAPAPVEGGAA